jgi:hypothetical protein
VTNSPAPSRATPYLLYFGPFRFESEIDIPELRTVRGSGSDARCVTIRLGDVPSTIRDAKPYGTYAQVAPTEYLLSVAGTARYYVRDGNEVRLDIEPGAPIENVSTYLLGSVFGVLCHQNGLLPLHASAVEHAGSVTAFLGDSGAGKSTLAACLQRRGHRIISDDICLLESSDAFMRVIPVAGWLKLWNQSLQHLGETPREEHRVFSTDDKFRLFLDLPHAASNRLSCIVFLSRHPDQDTPSRQQPTLQPLALPDAIAALMDMTYASYVPHLMGQDARVFRQCARVFEQARAYRLIVPWDLTRLDDTLDLLEAKIFVPLSADSAAASSQSEN